MAEMYGLTEEELYNMAYSNTQRKMPPPVKTIRSVCTYPQPEEDEDMEEIGLWTISNSNFLFGAASILYDSLLFELAEKLDDDLFIIPSSIHECRAVPVSMAKLQDVKNMHMEAGEMLNREEWLSDQIYIYSRKMRKLTIAKE